MYGISYYKKISYYKINFDFQKEMLLYILIEILCRACFSKNKFLKKISGKFFKQ